MHAVRASSHNLGAVTDMCSRAAWREHGRVRAAGAAPEVVQAYQAAERQGSLWRVIWSCLMLKQRLRAAALRLLGLSHVNRRLDEIQAQLRLSPVPALPTSPQSLEAFMAVHNPYQYEYPIFLDYPVRPMGRYTRDQPHPLLYAMFDRERPSFEYWIGQMGNWTDRLAAIPARAHDGVESTEPNWLNGWFPGLDALMLYTLMAQNKPARFLEVGSGNSTKFARRAIRDHNLSTTITSIDPQPRAEVEAICDRVIRAPLEETDLAVFGELGAGDILMIDCSHRIFQGSDVTVLLLEVLPYLPEGVLLQFHDIYLPYDYPELWLGRYYSEQYGVATMLLADQGQRYQILMSNAFATYDAALQSLLTTTVLLKPGLDELEPYGGSLWLRIRRPA